MNYDLPAPELEKEIKKNFSAVLTKAKKTDYNKTTDGYSLLYITPFFNGVIVTNLDSKKVIAFAEENGFETFKIGNEFYFYKGECI